MKHAGIILAAGASTRMGEPKALLETPMGVPLAVCQVDLLRNGGCRRVVVVLGSDHERIQGQLLGCEVVVHSGWEDGRFSSVQAGLRAVQECDGAFILPVDTVGVSERTVRAVLQFADRNRPDAVRPVFQGQPGKIAWIGWALAEEILQTPRDARLDLILKDRAANLPVDDAAILSNVNTPAEWADAVRRVWPDAKRQAHLRSQSQSPTVSPPQCPDRPGNTPASGRPR
jgi:CTP:molybdopterin cytidylyltransferase MocA